MNKTWFVTGAARGIGAEIVKAALNAGDRVVATGRDPKKIERCSDGRIADYAKALADMHAFYENRSPNQAGDPAKLAAVIVHLASVADPPVSFVAGSDAVVRATDAIKQRAAQLDAWRALSISTDGDWAVGADEGVADASTSH